MLLLERRPTLGGMACPCVGTSASSLVMEKQQPSVFPSWRGRAPRRRKITWAKARRWQWLPKTVSHFTGPCPGPSVVPDNFQVPEMCKLLLGWGRSYTQLLPATRAIGTSSVPAHCPALLPPPCWLLVRWPGSLRGLCLGVALALPSCCLSRAVAAVVLGPGIAGALKTCRCQALPRSVKTLGIKHGC